MNRLVDFTSTTQDFWVEVVIIKIRSTVEPKSYDIFYRKCLRSSTMGKLLSTVLLMNKLAQSLEQWV